MLSRRSLLAGTASAIAAPTRRPNLLFVVADTWRAQALGVGTPHLDRLAAQGFHGRRVYTSYAVCCPSRAAMLTGKMPHAAGVRVNHTRLPLTQPTMSAAMKNAGYRTGYIGKWHLDGDDSPGFVPPERRRGFDEWRAYNLAHRHFDTAYFHDDPAPVKTSGFEPGVQTDMAIDFLRKDRARPFYLYLSYVAPHAPFTPPARYTRAPESIELRPNVPKASETEARRDLAGYHGLCSAVDDNIGRLLEAVEVSGAAEDTIVIFTSDHGHMLWSHGIDGIDLPYEESARIPLIVRYPRRIRPGTSHEGLLSNIDFAPTLMGLCGVAPMAGVQGRNVAKQWMGKGGSADSIYAEGGLDGAGEWRMVVRGRYKLVVDDRRAPTHLFDLGRDPYELENLVGEAGFARVIAELQAVRRRWARRTGEARTDG